MVQQWSYEQRKPGANFVLCDSDGKQVWSLSSVGDYENSDETQQDILRNEIWRSGKIIECSKPRRFQIQLVKQAELIEFEVQKTSDGKWMISEVRRIRKSFVVEPPTVPKLLKPDLLVLPHLGTITLPTRSAEPTHAVRNIACGFDVDAEGNFSFIRSENGHHQFLSVDSQEKLLTQFDIELVYPDHYQLDSIASAGKSEFVLTASGSSVGDMSIAWRIDARDHTVTKLAAFKSPYVEGLAAFNDGRFIVLARAEEKYSSSMQLQICDPLGNRIKLIEEAELQGDPIRMADQSAMTVNSRNEICVLDQISQKVVIFGDDGKFRKAWELEKLWGYEPSYPNAIAASADGGLVIQDVDGINPLVQMDATGKVLSNFTPRNMPNHSPIEFFEAIRVAPDGRIWISDGNDFLRLGEGGVVDTRLGEPVDPKSLGKIDSIHVDRSGRLYAQSVRSGAVHLFEADGKFDRVVHHDSLLGHETDLRSVNVTDDGTLLVSGGDFTEKTLSFFFNDGELVKSITTPSYYSFCYQPIRRRLLFSENSNVLVTSMDAEPQDVIKRHADQTWLAIGGQLAMAPDSSFAILTDDLSRSGHLSKLSIFEGDLKPRCTIELDGRSNRFDYDGRFLAVSIETNLLFFSATGQPLGWIELEQTKRPTPYLINGGTELMLIDSTGARTINRYDLSPLIARANKT